MDRIIERGTVIKEHKAALFEVALEENPNHIVHATLSGKIRIRKIRVAIGDTVTVEISPYALTRGRIIWRH